MAPDATGAMRKIAEDVRPDPGWALARVGDGGWWPAIERGLRDGTFEQDVLDGLAHLVRDRDHRVAWITTVPSVHLDEKLVLLARRLAAELEIAEVQLLSRVAPRPPQREMSNAVQQAGNVRGAFAVTAKPPDGAGVLLDDHRGSGWTLAMTSGQLRLAGAERITPITLTTIG